MKYLASLMIVRFVETRARARSADDSECKAAATAAAKPLDSSNSILS